MTKFQILQFYFTNPAIREVRISNEVLDFDFAQLKLYNFSGKLILETKFDWMQGEYYTLPLEKISAVAYLLMKISADGKIGRSKVITR